MCYFYCPECTEFTSDMIACIYIVRSVSGAMLYSMYNDQCKLPVPWSASVTLLTMA